MTLEYFIQHSYQSGNTYFANFNVRSRDVESRKLGYECSNNHIFSFNMLTSDGNLEIPNLIASYNDRLINDGYTQIKYGLDPYIIDSLNVTGTLSGACNRFYKGSIERKLMCIKDRKGELYYGNTSIILDKDMQVLYLTTWKGVETAYHRFTAVTPMCYISNKIFLQENKDKFMHKSIREKLLPIICTSKAYYYYADESEPIKVIIDDLTNLIEKPAKATPSIADDDKINDFLIAHIDNFLL